ncbi:hypothetical protein SDC9_201525 [bioreactor metagenome]|uniref:Uncharacterized protein n=1 Tax=bioreactor metagenome TaxID=1076179 RepID=A0A645IRK4_9ZZZZ
MLDHQHGMAGISQPVQHMDQLIHIGHVQAHRRLIQHIKAVLVGRQGYASGIARLSWTSAHLGKLGHQFDALRLSARQGRTGLPQGQVTQADILQQLQGVGDCRMCGEKAHRFVYRHRQNLGHGLVAPAH